MNRFITLAFVSVLVTATAAQSAPSASGKESAVASRDKIICKRFSRIGSLVDSYRTCKPRSEWDRERDNVRQLNVTDSCRDRGNGGSLCNP